MFHESRPPEIIVTAWRRTAPNATTASYQSE
jgi:hypothetical protein